MKPKASPSRVRPNSVWPNVCNVKKMSAHPTFNLENPLASLLTHCEVYCVAACCQDNAFECGVEHVEPWIHEHGYEATKHVLRQIEALRRELPDSAEDMIETDLFMATWRMREFDTVISAAETTLNVVLKSRGLECSNSIRQTGQDVPPNA